MERWSHPNHRTPRMNKNDLAHGLSAAPIHRQPPLWGSSNPPIVPASFRATNRCSTLPASSIVCSVPRADHRLLEGRFVHHLPQVFVPPSNLRFESRLYSSASGALDTSETSNNSDSSDPTFPRKRSYSSPRFAKQPLTHSFIHHSSIPSPALMFSQGSFLVVWLTCVRLSTLDIRPSTFTALSLNSNINMNHSSTLNQQSAI